RVLGVRKHRGLVNDTVDVAGYCRGDPPAAVGGLFQGNGAMPRSKPPILPLSAIESGQFADCFALLTERRPGTTSAGNPYFPCRFRDAGRSVTYMVWADGPHYAECEQRWRIGKCYKLRCIYVDHEKYGPQIDVQQAREATDDDKSDGFDPLALIERSRGEP